MCVQRVTLRRYQLNKNLRILFIRLEQSPIINPEVTHLTQGCDNSQFRRLHTGPHKQNQVLVPGFSIKFKFLGLE